MPLSSYPSPDFGGTWWTGIDDDGWGISLAYFGDIIIAVIYYYDDAGNPRWVLGQNSGFERNVEIAIDLYEHHGFGRTATPIETTKIIAGTATFILSSYSQILENDATMTIDINYQGSQGGNWSRTNVPLSIFTKPH